LELLLRRPALRAVRETALITPLGLERPGHPALTRLRRPRALKESRTHAQLRVDWSGRQAAAELEAAFSSAPDRAAKRLLCNWRPVPTEPAGLLESILLEANDSERQKRWADLGRSEQRRLIPGPARQLLCGERPRPFREELRHPGGVNLGEVTDGHDGEAPATWAGFSSLRGNCSKSTA